MSKSMQRSCYLSPGFELRPDGEQQAILALLHDHNVVTSHTSKEDVSLSFCPHEIVILWAQHLSGEIGHIKRLRQHLRQTSQCFVFLENLQLRDAQNLARLGCTGFAEFGDLQALTEWIQTTRVSHPEVSCAVPSEEISGLAKLSAIGEAASILSHQIAQPLSAIVNYSEATALTLSQSQPNSLPLDDLLLWQEQISQLSQTTAKSLRQLTDILRQIEVQPKSLEFASLLKQVLSEREAELKCQQVLSQWDIPSTPCPIHSNPLLARQLITELLNNAIQAVTSLDNGPRKLRVTLTTQKDVALFTIEDSGPGLSEKDFQKFSRSPAPSQDDAFGLGLPLCHAITKKLSGRMWSEHPKKGLKVCVEIPLSTINRHSQ